MIVDRSKKLSLVFRIMGDSMLTDCENEGGHKKAVIAEVCGVLFLPVDELYW